MVDRYNRFARKAEGVTSGAAFRRVFREKKASGIVFDDNAIDPVEYWLIEADGQHFLFPQPGRSGFEELTPCFEGQNQEPSKVSTVQPAILKKQNGQLVLKEGGHVS